MPTNELSVFDRPETQARILSEEEKANIEAGRKEADAILAAEGKAKFKIELMFTEKWSVINPVPGIVSFWETGSQLHGGGDTIVHFCPGRKLKVNDCEHYIPDPSHGYGFLVCPSCHKVWNGDQVFGQIISRLTSKGWAELIEKYYRRLDMNCDIVIKYHKTDIRKASAAGIHVEDTLRMTRSAEKRLKRIYTLKALMQDMAAGSALYDRILAFVRA
jgi:hypothetical protein